jgi:hypothetical protein
VSKNKSSKIPAQAELSTEDTIVHLCLIKEGVCYNELFRSLFPAVTPLTLQRSAIVGQGVLSALNRTKCRPGPYGVHVGVLRGYMSRGTLLHLFQPNINKRKVNVIIRL